MSSEKSKIMIVDDSTMMSSMARRILEHEFDVSVFNSGEECLENVSKIMPNLILLDFYMKGIDGFNVLHALKEDSSTNEIPVIFMTGDEHGETEVKALREGAFDFISKPFVPAVLLQRVKNAVQLSKLQKDLQSEVKHETAKTRLLTMEVLLALSSTIEAKDHYTKGHSHRVAKYASEIAKRLGKNEEEQRDIYMMGLMHDIGKIGVAGDIIRKKSKLEEDEFEEIKEHPIKGYEILKTITVMPGLATGARWHHEHFDGTGYPDGLKGNQIPEEARIIAVADVYDAMTSKRSYSDVRPQSDVRAEIERCKGTYFDPIIADVMLRMIDEDKNYQMREM